jgi:hypothetical protein
MPRNLTAAQKAIVTSRVKRICTLVDIQIPAHRILVWDGIGYVTFGGVTYGGLGNYGMVEGIGEELSVAASRISMTLYLAPGMDTPPDFVTKTRDLKYQDAPVTIYHAFTDIDTDLPISDPFVVWTGLADVMTFRLGEQVGCTLTAENYSSHLRRANTLRCTSVSHNKRLGNPTVRDGFFDFNTRLNSRKMVITA